MVAQSSTNTTAKANEIQTTDQNGTVHQFSLDKLGRQTLDQVVTLGRRIDGTVMASPSLTTSAASRPQSAASTRRKCGEPGRKGLNGFQQLISEYQEHDGPVNAAPHHWSSTATPTVRPTRSGHVGHISQRQNLIYSYGTAGGMDDNLSRITAFNWTGDGTTVHTYLGLGTIVRVDNQQPGVRYDLIPAPARIPMPASTNSAV